jgi:hypothetical protein
MFIYDYVDRCQFNALVHVDTYVYNIHVFVYMHISIGICYYSIG